MLCSFGPSRQGFIHGSYSKIEAWQSLLAMLLVLSGQSLICQSMRPFTGAGIAILAFLSEPTQAIV